MKVETWIEWTAESREPIGTAHPHCRWVVAACTSYKSCMHGLCTNNDRIARIQLYGSSCAAAYLLYIWPRKALQKAAHYSGHDITNARVRELLDINMCLLNVKLFQYGILMHTSLYKLLANSMLLFCNQLSSCTCQLLWCGCMCTSLRRVDYIDKIDQIKVMLA